jgi:hypothetical protein
MRLAVLGENLLNITSVQMEHICWIELKFIISIDLVFAIKYYYLQVLRNNNTK